MEGKRGTAHGIIGETAHCREGEFVTGRIEKEQRGAVHTQAVVDGVQDGLQGFFIVEGAGDLSACHAEVASILGVDFHLAVPLLNEGIIHWHSSGMNNGCAGE